ncbi:hypothetical protein I6F40_09270 [Pseudoalteromonas sp. SWXJ133]|uniref:hypothetical protein n=1 Tax=Pseudoalteromonas sp. SWXJ133 TaxID=2792069 RepID=UPI0018CEFBB0|nr:hypothetical protein [Pseudoalteromonas sp. SWXJ133]MBH0020529.1 hypothetical protein [Pseudoalteromonas sp. SWXJ133]
MNKYLIPLSLLASFTCQAELDLTIPKENCFKAVEIVKNKDKQLFKQLFTPVDQIPNADKEITKLIDSTHKKYFGKEYDGIKNFRLVESKLVNYSEDTKYSVVEETYERWGYKEQAFIYYKFDAYDKRLKEQRTVYDKCRFGLKDGNWYMVNLLQD